MNEEWNLMFMRLCYPSPCGHFQQADAKLRLFLMLKRIQCQNKPKNAFYRELFRQIIVVDRITPIFS